MPGLLIKKLPPDLHAKLKAAAQRHRRSMTQETLVILERSLSCAAAEFPDPVMPRKAITQRMIAQGIREGRP